MFLSFSGQQCTVGLLSGFPARVCQKYQAIARLPHGLSFSLAFWFYKKGCQEKKLSRELSAAKFSASSPLPLCRFLEA
jgi:hypothetical protein